MFKPDMFDSYLLLQILPYLCLNLMSSLGLPFDEGQGQG